MDGNNKRLGKNVLRSSGSDLALHAYRELKSQDGIDEKLKMLRKEDSGFKVSQLGGMLAESESLSMINETHVASMNASAYKIKRHIFAPKNPADATDIKYAATGFTDSIYGDNYSKSKIVDTHTGELKDTSNVLIGGNNSSLMVLDASGSKPTADIYFDYGEGGSLGSLKLELTSERISQKDIKDVFLQGYNRGGIEEGVSQLLALAKQNFENYICIIYPDLRVRSGESIMNASGEVVSKVNTSTFDLPTYVIFYRMGTSFMTALSRATPGSPFKNSIFKIHSSDIRRISNSRPYFDAPMHGAEEDMYK